MRLPKSVKEANSQVSEEMESEKLEICRKYLWNDEVSAEEANVIINEFNARYLSQGGSKGGCIVNK